VHPRCDILVTKRGRGTANRLLHGDAHVFQDIYVFRLQGDSAI
jgi:hypothetical protein